MEKARNKQQQQQQPGKQSTTGQSSHQQQNKGNQGKAGKQEMMGDKTDDPDQSIRIGDNPDETKKKIPNMHK